MELFVDVAEVIVDGFGADEQLIGDFLVEKSLAEELENFFLPLRQAANAVAGRRLRRAFQEFCNAKYQSQS